jgi:hypothetical protein
MEKGFVTIQFLLPVLAHKASSDGSSKLRKAEQS